MSPLTIEETLQFRALKRTGVVLMLLLRLDKPVGETEIAALLDIAPKTARNQLRSLAAIGLVTRANFHKGWILTGMGQQLVLPMDQVEVEEESKDTMAEKLIEAEVVETPEGGADEFIEEVTQEPQTGHSGVNPVKVTGLPIININNNCFKESFKGNNNKQAVKMTGLTPGRAVREPPVRTTTVEEPTPEELAIIQALKKRGIMLNRRNSRLIGKITEEDIESAWTTLSWQGKEFESGLLVYMLEQMAISQDLARPKYDRHGQIINNFRVLEDNTYSRDYGSGLIEDNRCPPSDNETEVPAEAQAAWEEAQPGIRRQVPAAEYETWVKGITLGGFQDDCLVFTVVNHYARDWLEAHRDTFERCLGMEVRFGIQGSG